MNCVLFGLNLHGVISVYLKERNYLNHIFHFHPVLTQGLILKVHNDIFYYLDLNNIFYKIFGV